jgi:hypothetical protein
MTKLRKLVARAVRAQKTGDLANAKRLLGLAIVRMEELNRAFAHEVKQTEASWSDTANAAGTFHSRHGSARRTTHRHDNA